MRNSERMRVIALLLFTLCCCLASAQVAFDTSRFDVQLDVGADRSLTVTEWISVQFREPRRGIVRTLPITVRSESAQRTVQYQVLGAEANDSPVPVQQETSGDTLTLKIGDANRRVTGSVTYTIRYRVLGALSNIEKADEWGPRAEMMWNAIPSGWPTGTSAARIEVRFPDPTSELFGVRALFGPVGSRAGTELFWGKSVNGRTDLISVSLPSRQKAIVEAKKPLDKGFGITVVLALPKGTVSEHNDAILRNAPESQFPTQSELPNNPLGIFLPIIPVLFGLPWALKRRFIKPGPLVVRFDPPEGVDPMRGGVLFDDNFQPRDLLAGLISLCQKGAGRMQAIEGKLQFHLGEQEPSGLSKLERQLLDSLRSYGPVVSPDALRGVFAPSFNALGAQAKADLTHDGWRRKGMNPQWLGCGLFFLLTVVSCAGLIYTGFYACIGFVLATILLVLITLMPTPWTPVGVRKKWELEGLKEFVIRAHKDPLEFAAKHQPSAALYERILPYAISFGLVQQWSKAFEGVQMAQPGWFDGSADSHFPWFWYFSDGYSNVSSDWNHAGQPPTSSWTSGGSGLGGGYSSDGGFDGGGGFDSGGSVGDGGGGGGGGDW